MRSQTAIFSKLVKDFMRQVPLSVKTGAPCRDVIAQMAAGSASSATVVDSAKRPIGIVTEQDITRRVSFQVSPTAPIDSVMTAPVITIGEGEYLYQAIGRMRKRGLRHMPVVGLNGALAGILDLHDAMFVASERLMDQIDRLTHEGTLEGLGKIKSAQVELARGLFADNLPAPEIQALLTGVNNGIYLRVIDISLREMAEQGWGEPPVPFAAIVMGSGGRGENYLFPDQDNGLILGDYSDSEHNRIDAFFVELSERMTRDLDKVGLPYCNGYCMATNPLWRKTLKQWIGQVDLWSRKRNLVAIRLSDIFFDFQPVWGDRGLAASLRREVTELVKANHFFLQEMYRETADHNVALGLFGGFITERDKEEYKGQVNLKHTGTLPLVEAVRILALREGVEETPTLERISKLNALGVLDANEADELANAFGQLTNILLRQQIKDFRSKNRVS
ncbi:MAG: DUF294 nucleotidyltransferase-like domain-containing protein, partial [Rhodospirillales bacterium]